MNDYMSDFEQYSIDLISSLINLACELGQIMTGIGANLT